MTFRTAALGRRHRLGVVLHERIVSFHRRGRERQSSHRLYAGAGQPAHALRALGQISSCQLLALEFPVAENALPEEPARSPASTERIEEVGGGVESFGTFDLIVAPTTALFFQARVLNIYPLALVPLFLGPPLGILTHVLSLRNLAVARTAVP
jgi:hypothetical protein